MFVKAIVYFDKGACSMAGVPSDTLKDVYVQSIDPTGVLINTHSTPDKGIPTFYPQRFIARIAMQEPLPMPKQPPLAIPRGMVRAQ